MDLRLIGYGAWALACLVVWLLVFADDLHVYHNERRRRGGDRRERSAATELWSDLALLLVAIASAVSLTMLVLGQDVPGLRGFTLAVALGGYLGAGIVKISLRKRSR